MSDDEGASPLERLQNRHKREKKELQAKITQLRHAVPKTDKKGKKEVTAEVEKLEKELKERHTRELADLELSTGYSQPEKPEAETANGDEASVGDQENGEDVATDDFYSKKQGGRQTKASKRREKKAEEAARRHEIHLEEVRNAANSKGAVEARQINELLTTRGLLSHQIEPDGDCLYNALAHQLNLDSRNGDEEWTGAVLRVRAAQYLRENRDDFAPFLANEDGEPLTKAQFGIYCEKVTSFCLKAYLRQVLQPSAKGGAWGGEPELRALAASLHRRIEVLQPNQRPQIYGEEVAGRPLVVTYHRFAYRLGEHYNSTKCAPLATPEE